MSELEAVSARAAAARANMAGRIEDFESACLTGTQAELSDAAFAIHRATSRLVSELIAQAEAILKFWGLDPATRPA